MLHELIQCNVGIVDIGFNTVYNLSKIVGDIGFIPTAIPDDPLMRRFGF